MHYFLNSLVKKWSNKLKKQTMDWRKFIASSETIVVKTESREDKYPCFLFFFFNKYYFAVEIVFILMGLL